MQTETFDTKKRKLSEHEKFQIKAKVSSIVPDAKVVEVFEEDAWASRIITTKLGNKIREEQKDLRDLTRPYLREIRAVAQRRKEGTLLPGDEERSLDLKRIVRELRQPVLQDIEYVVSTTLKKVINKYVARVAIFSETTIGVALVSNIGQGVEVTITEWPENELMQYVTERRA